MKSLADDKEDAPTARALRRVGRLRSSRLGLLLALTATAASGCRDAGVALGTSPAQARSSSDILIYALGSRFGPVRMVPGYEDLRSKLSGSALRPSRLFGDSVLWSSISGDTREIEIRGRPHPTGYLLGAREVAGAPKAPGEYRQSIRLRELGGDQFEWSVRDELTVGPVTSEALSATLHELLDAAEHGDSHGIRAAYRSALPRTTESLARLFTLDSIAVVPTRGGGSLLSLVAHAHPDRIAAEFPDLSRFLERYASPARVELVAEDMEGNRWWVATLDRDRMSLLLRVHDGRLAPLEGPPRPIPDQLRIRSELAARIRIFNIGASDLVADLDLHRDPDDTGFTARFRREPAWHFPPLVERLIRSALRRPFEGYGAFLAYSIRRASGRTTLVRHYQIAVQESAILRWLGGLGSSVFGDFRGGAEREYDRFVGELFAALRSDARVLLR